MEIEAPDPVQKISARIDRWASFLAQGGSESRISILLTQEFPEPDRTTILNEVIRRSQIKIAAQKKRHLIMGGIILALGLIPSIYSFFWLPGDNWFFFLGPIALGIYLMTRKGNRPTELDEFL